MLDGLGGVLCRCTGYAKIVEAVLDASGEAAALERPPAGAAVGAPMAKVDGVAKLTGAEAYGADVAPKGCLWLRAVRSPYARARFTIGDLNSLYERHPGLVRVLVARDIKGNNGFGVYPHIKDQPVLAHEQVRYRGEAVAALVGDAAAVQTITDEELPIAWQPLEPVTGIAAALGPGAPAVQDGKPDNILTRGQLRKGDLEAGFAAADCEVEGEFETGFVEHAYIEPEAGFARRRDDRIEIWAAFIESAPCGAR